MTERDGVDAIIEQWKRERPELDPSPIGIVGRVSRLARELEERLEPVYREHGLEGGWHDVLATLRRARPAVPAAADRPHRRDDADVERDDEAARQAREAGADRPRAGPERPPRRADRADRRRAARRSTPRPRRTSRTSAGCSPRSARTSSASSPTCCASSGSACRSDRGQALHRPGVPVRVLGRADPAAVALALRRPACAGG